MLLGRHCERRTLERLLDAARLGRSGALVLRGESGVGKTALLEHMCERASPWRVVSVSAVKSEMQLAFAALHQLCMPLSDGLERLPVPQRAALDVAFGRTEGIPADPFFVGLAVRSLWSAAPMSLYIVNPLTRQGLATLFATHPPLAERVRRLRALDRDQELGNDRALRLAA